MKKILGILMLGMVLGASSVHAEEAGGTGDGSCVGGREVIGSNSHHYCQSEAKMTWYAAVTWCQAQERHLATVYEACNANSSKAVPGSTNSDGKDPCYNITTSSSKITLSVWTSSNKDKDQAYTVIIWGGGGHSTSWNTRTKKDYAALCW